MFVRFCAILNATEFVVELCGDRSCLLHSIFELTAIVEVGDFADRGAYGGSAAVADFVELSELLVGDMTFLNVEAHIASELTEALVGDRGEDGFAGGSHVSVALNAIEVGSAALVEISLLLWVEI